MVGDVDAMRAFVGEGIPISIPEHPGVSMTSRPCSKAKADSHKERKAFSSQKCAQIFP